MLLRDLEGEFVRRDPARNSFWAVSSIEDADGVWFLCPKCFAANGGAVGTHRVICWRPRVPAGVIPGPGRWELVGTSLDDLELVAGSSSILLPGEPGGCGAHFWVRGGAIVDLS